MWEKLLWNSESTDLKTIEQYLDCLRTSFEELKNKNNQELIAILNNNQERKNIDPIGSQYWLPTHLENWDLIPNGYTLKVKDWDKEIWLFQMRNGLRKDITIENMMKHDFIA